jgi:hypothetical protein
MYKRLSTTCNLECLEACFSDASQITNIDVCRLNSILMFVVQVFAKYLIVTGLLFYGENSFCLCNFFSFRFVSGIFRYFNRIAFFGVYSVLKLNHERVICF